MLTRKLVQKRRYEEDGRGRAGDGGDGVAEKVHGALRLGDAITQSLRIGTDTKGNSETGCLMSQCNK